MKVNPSTIMGAMRVFVWLLFTAIVCECKETTDESMLVDNLISSLGRVGSQSLGKRYEPLASWLWNLSITIPDQEFREGIAFISIKDMKCTHFTVTSIKSNYIPSKPAMDQDPSIRLSVLGISAWCKGKYGVSGLSGFVEAQVDSVEGDGPALGMSITFISSLYDNRIPFANSTSTNDCTANLHVPPDGLHFSGSASSAIINMFKKTISGYVSSALSSELCPVLEVELDQTLTKLLQKADHFMTGLIPSSTSPSRRQLATNAVDRIVWRRDVPILIEIIDVLNWILNRYMSKGLLLDALGMLGIHNIEGDCGYFFRGFNGLIKTLTHNTGEVHFHIPDLLHDLQNITFVVPGYASISVFPKKLVVGGLDTLSNVTLFQPSRNGDFASIVNSEEGFNASVYVGVQVSSIEGGAFQGDTLDESFIVSLNTDSFQMNGHVSLDVNKTRFDRVTAGHVISAINGSKSDLDCVVFPLDSLIIPHLTSSVGFESISFIPLSDQNGTTPGELEKDLDGALNNLLRLFLREYRVLVTETIAGLSDGLLRTKLNAFVKDLVDRITRKYQPETSCQTTDSHLRMNTTADFLNFNHAKILQKIQRFLNKSSTLEHANNYLSCVADVLTEQVVTTYPTTSLAGLDITLSSANIDNLGTVQDIDFICPEDGFHLNYGVELGECSRSDQLEKCVGPTLSGTLDIESSSMNLVGQVNFSAWVDEIVGSGWSLILYDIAKFRQLTVPELLSCGYCAFMPTSELVLYAAKSSIVNLGFNSSATFTIGPDEPFLLKLSSEEYPEFPLRANAFVSWIVSTITDWANGAVKYVLPRSGARCHPGNNTSTETNASKDSGDSLLFHLFPFFILAQIGFFALSGKIRDEVDHERNDVELVNHLLEPEINHPLGSMEREIPPETDGKTLIADQRVVDPLKHMFPMFIFCSIALLAASNLSVGASVDMVVSTNTSSIPIPSLFGFSLASTISEMYQARIYALLFLVAVFSGIWPYAKLLLVLFAYTAPPSVLNLRTREKSLSMLDALSKFSLVDTFVLVLMMVSFRYRLQLADTTLDVFVNPQFGFYGFLAATTASLLAGHIALYLHRRCLSNSLPIDGGKAPIMNHSFHVNGIRFRISREFKSLVVVLVALTTVLLMIGSTKKAFHFEFGGLAGAVLPDNRSSYSLLTLGAELPHSVQHPGLGVRVLQLAYYFYALIMPLLCLSTLLTLWVVRLGPSRQRQLLIVAEVANAWSAIEVFVLSIVVSLFEISTFASFIIGDRCDLLDRVLASHEVGVDNCFSLRSYVGFNAWYLIAGVLLNSFVVSALLRFSRVIIEKSTHEEDDGTQDIFVTLFRSPLGKWLFVPDHHEAFPVQNDQVMDKTAEENLLDHEPDEIREKKEINDQDLVGSSSHPQEGQDC